VDRMLREFRVDANVGKPQVAYRETIRTAIEKGRAPLRSPDRRPWPVRPRRAQPRAHRAGGGYESSTKITGGVIPKEYIPAVDAGIQDAMQSGVLAGFPTVDLRATLVYGSYHDVDSSEMAFKIAASMCFKEAASAPTRCSWSRSWPSRSLRPRTTLEM